MSNNLTKRQIVQSIYEGANYNHKHLTEIVQRLLITYVLVWLMVKMLSFETLVFLNFSEEVEGWA